MVFFQKENDIFFSKMVCLRATNAGAATAAGAAAMAAGAAKR